MLSDDLACLHRGRSWRLHSNMESDLPFTVLCDACGTWWDSGEDTAAVMAVRAGHTFDTKVGSIDVTTRREVIAR